MTQDLAELDLVEIQRIATVPVEESRELERKASEKFTVNTDGRVTDDTRAAIAKQVCAFSNADGGLLIFGIRDAKDGGGIDGGVPSTIGREPVKDWAEKIIPKLLHPSVAGCEAKFIEYTPARSGALVIRVPPSENRPHWTIENGQECP